MDKLDSILKHLNEETYVFKIKLLSDKDKTIELRPIKTKDQKSLIVDVEEAKTELDRLLLIFKLLDKCIIKNDVPLGDITFEDFLWLLINLRMKSLGETTTLKTNCKYCDYNKNTFVIDLRNAEITYLDKIENNVINVTSKLKISLGFVTVEDMLNIIAFEDEEYKKIATFASMIKQVEYEDEILDIDSLDEKIKLLEEFSKKELDKFSEFLEKNKFGTKIKVSFKCGKNKKDENGKEILTEGCGKENTVELDGIDVIDFF